MKGLVNQAGLTNFFGDGSDGAFNPATILANATAPNGGVVANLWDMSAGTSFTTGSLTSASDCVLFQIDFGVPTYLAFDNNTFQCYIYNAAISTGANRNLAMYGSANGSSWTKVSSDTVFITTSASDRTLNQGGSGTYRYWKLVLVAGGSTCTFTCNGITLNAMPYMGDGQTNRIWNIVYTSALNGQAVVKQFSSLTLPTGYLMTVNNPCKGLVIYCQGNADISGIIDMSKKAGIGDGNESPSLPILPKTFASANTTANIAGSVLAFDKFGKTSNCMLHIRGGSGGNGGKGGPTNAGTGGSGRVLAGGFGGGGGGGDQGSASGVGGSIVATGLCNPSINGSVGYTNSSIGNQGGRAGVHGQGGTGDVYANASNLARSGAGGGCYGGGGGGGGGGYANSSGSGYAGDGSNGEYAGGAVILIAGGNITINATGSIRANGGNGGGGGYGSCPSGSGATGGGGGGGSGGGVVVAFYAGTYTNNGSISVSAGTGGAGGAQGSSGTVGTAGSSGGVGTIHLQKVS